MNHGAIEMKRVLTIILGLVMMLPMNAGKPNDFALKRGINLSHWLSQGPPQPRTPAHASNWLEHVAEL